MNGTSCCTYPHCSDEVPEQLTVALRLAAVFGSCALEESRLLTIALSFGFSIFVLVYAAASFSGGAPIPGTS